MTAFLYVACYVVAIAVIFSVAVAVVAICRVSGRPVDEQQEPAVYVCVKPKVSPWIAAYMRN